LGNGATGWPFGARRGAWTIENGYNTGPDHGTTGHEYELYSFDFQRSGGTTGQAIVSPVTGDAIDIGSAYPGDFSPGRCARISIDGYADHYMMVCHIAETVKSMHGTRGVDMLGNVSGGPNGDHIHITLY
jgi:hypothetical protein